jgi:hypothetical protein
MYLAKYLVGDPVFSPLYPVYWYHNAIVIHFLWWFILQWNKTYLFLLFLMSPSILYVDFKL